ncbi:uncharacterized protein LOC110844709 isoform X2 [Folsomia candida]|uniref:uncharacterized protein LOC110844709 isoform X2 n=1 Tax=Folsomia candida TaxID=158441 RepID=UPI001604F44B|nr:uncharacterized protein LOC110844709 isoform X2 [Folsomia candida]
MLEGIFGGEIKTTIKCVHCSNQRINSEHFLDISLPIVVSGQGSANNNVSLEECLSAHMDVEFLVGENSVECDKCRRIIAAKYNKTPLDFPSISSPAEKSSRISTPPANLVLHLKRFLVTPNGIVKRDSPVIFPAVLDMSTFLSESIESKTIKYDLFGLVEHLGNFDDQGHYVAYRRRPIDEDYWFICNDEKVSKTCLANVLSRQAYILFYKESESSEMQEKPVSSGLHDNPVQDNIPMDHQVETISDVIYIENFDELSQDYIEIHFDSEDSGILACPVAEVPTEVTSQLTSEVESNILDKTRAPEISYFKLVDPFASNKSDVDTNLQQGHLDEQDISIINDYNKNPRTCAVCNSSTTMKWHRKADGERVCQECAKRILLERKNIQFKRVDYGPCSNCTATKSSRWSTKVGGGEEGTLCKTCYDYELKHKSPRPRKSSGKGRLPVVKNSGPCSNCGTTKSKRWIIPKGQAEIFCNTCYQFQRKHKSPRPRISSDNGSLQSVLKNGGPCSNCCTTKSKRWTTPHGEVGTLCKTCYDYELKHKSPRPTISSGKGRLPVLKNGGPCSNCGTTKSGRWTIPKGQAGILCNACYQFELKHKSPRPRIPSDNGSLQSVLENSGPCSNCGTEKSCRWITPKGQAGILCNTCYVFERNHKRPRPSIPSDNGSLQSVLKNSGPCANCGTEKSCRWITPKGQAGILCNTCYVFERNHKRPRPSIPSDNGSLQSVLKNSGPCANCGTEKSCRWTIPKGQARILCNTCYQFELKHKSPRPRIPSDNGSLQSVLENSGPCSNCGTEKSSRWATPKGQGILCNTCYFYQHRVKRPRPRIPSDKGRLPPSYKPGTKRYKNQLRLRWSALHKLEGPCYNCYSNTEASTLGTNFSDEALCYDCAVRKYNVKPSDNPPSHAYTTTLDGEIINVDLDATDFKDLSQTWVCPYRDKEKLTIEGCIIGFTKQRLVKAVTSVRQTTINSTSTAWKLVSFFRNCIH